MRSSLLNEIRYFISDIPDDVRGVYGSLKRGYWQKKAGRRIMPLKQASENLLELSVPEQIDSLLRENPDLLNNLSRVYSDHPTSVTLGIMNRNRRSLVVAIWRDAQQETKIVGFSPNLSCTMSAIHDVSTHTHNGTLQDGGYVYHTQFGSEFPKMIEEANDRMQKDTMRFLATYNYAPKYPTYTFNYNLKTMSPLRYIAAAAQGLFAGEDMHPLNIQLPNTTRRDR